MSEVVEKKSKRCCDEEAMSARREEILETATEFFARARFLRRDHPGSGGSAPDRQRDPLSSFSQQARSLSGRRGSGDGEAATSGSNASIASIERRARTHGEGNLDLSCLFCRKPAALSS